MTNADTINLKLAEMEGECVCDKLKASKCRSGLQQEITDVWECVLCGNFFVWNNGIARRKNKRIPDRLSDGAYILGLVERYNLTVVPEDYGWRVFPRFLKNSNFHSKDKFVKHAIALAAIQRWKESSDDSQG